MFAIGIITAIASLANVLLALLVLIDNKRSYTNVLFATLSVSAGVWAILNFVSLQVTTPDIALLITRLVMTFVVLQTTSFFLLMFTFPERNINLRPITIKLYLGFSFIALLLTVSPWVFTGLDLTNSLPPPVPKPGPGIAVFILHALISLGGGGTKLIKQQRSSTGLRKIQWSIVLFATVALFAIVPITNFVAVVVFGFSNFILLSPIYVLIFVAAIYYAIAFHKFLDIRLVVVRSVAYVLSVSLIVAIYSVLVFGLINQFFPDTQMTSLQQALYIGAAVILALTFHPLKLFFDSITERMFYRDRYETEDVLNRLGKVFVQKSNSFDLLDDSLRIITQTLKTKTGYLVVMDDDKIYKVAATPNADQKHITNKHLSHFTKQLTIYDETEQGDMEYKKLNELGAYLALRLELQGKLIGYLILGEKQSGTVFTQQDINLLEILSQELAVAIQNAKSYEEIQAFSETLKKEVRDATAKLRETNKRLRKLDEAKDEFISMASHQLRTPLTTIKGYLSMLLEGDAGKLPKKSKEFIDLAFVSSERMVHLIADMLNVSRISTGRLTIDENEIDLVEVVEEELEQLRRQAEAKDVDLILHKPDDKLPKLKLDENKMRQVIMNFSDNAIYYTPEGKVNVYIEVNDGFVEFRVVDNGIGVSKEAQKQLFNKFFRAENARQVRPDGTGLGLYMAKQVIEAQDGEIIFSSKKGKGSTFGFRFKLKDKQAE